MPHNDHRMEEERQARQQANREQLRALIRALVPEERPTALQLLLSIRIAIGLVVLLLVLSLIGLPFGITPWDWLKLLIVPLVLVVGGYLFTRADHRRTLDQADHRRQEDVLQAYLDQMRQLLLDKDRPLRQPKANCEARTAAQVGTLTTLERIQNPDKKGIIVKFLWGCRLLEKQDTVVILEEANLEGADLGEAKLIGANLRKVHLGPLGPDLRRTKSERAKLGGAQLFDADLSGADLRKVLLRGADLSGAKLAGANLAGANLEEADLSNANLEEAVLSNANLRGANLKGAIMPNGQKYED